MNSEIEVEVNDIEYFEEKYLKNLETGYEVLEVEDREIYKLAEIKSEKGNMYKAIVYPDFADYSKIKKGNRVEGWVRMFTKEKGSTTTQFVDYLKPERNWSKGEKFYSYKD